MNNASVWKRISTVLLACAAMSIAASAQTFTNLVGFDYTDGAYPYYGSLTQGVDGNLYGTTNLGGATSMGTVFRITASGTLTTLYSFCVQGPPCIDGEEPYGGLVQAPDGNFYGTTSNGGANGWGTVFKITPSGKFTTVYSFCPQGFPCADGFFPYAGLVQGADGNFYGTTQQGGANGQGTVFKLTAGGTLTTLYSFCALTSCADGALLYAGLIQASDGSLYGTTLVGGAHGAGTVFKITAAGALTTVHSFDITDGSNPYSGLVQASDGNFYGTTANGGKRDDGTIFKITPAGKLTTIYNFCSITYCPDGVVPYGDLVQATDGSLDGTTLAGGANNSGIIFKLSADGALTTLYSFCADGYPNCTDGGEPFAGLLQATNGDFYGTTFEGGDLSCSPPFGCGSIFSLSTGLGPFVKTLPAAGKVGVQVGILGTDLTGATNVTFNGTAAQFTVRSPSLILSHVPAGATTGTVEVTLPSGTLSSNVPFYVLK